MKKGEDLVIDIDSLDHPLEKRKFDIKLREIDIGHLNISNALTKLQSDEYLKKGLLA